MGPGPVTSCRGRRPTVTASIRAQLDAPLDDVEKVMKSSADRPVPSLAIAGQAFGLFAGAMAISVFAAVLGIVHHAPWVAGVAAVGSVASTLALRSTLRRRNDQSSAQDFAAWWRQRGLWLTLGSSLPAYVAVAWAAATFPHR
jgi:hypothetical protein